MIKHDIKIEVDPSTGISVVTDVKSYEVPDETYPLIKQ